MNSQTPPVVAVAGSIRGSAMSTLPGFVLRAGPGRGAPPPKIDTRRTAGIFTGTSASTDGSRRGAKGSRLSTFSAEITCCAHR